MSLNWLQHRAGIWCGVWTDGKHLDGGDILIVIPARGSRGSVKAITMEVGEGSFTGQKEVSKMAQVSFSPQNTFLKLKVQ